MLPVSVGVFLLSSIGLISHNMFNVRPNEYFYQCNTSNMHQEILQKMNQTITNNTSEPATK